MFTIEPESPNYPQFSMEIRKKPRFYLNQSYIFNQRPLLAVVGAREAHQWILEWLENELKSFLEKSHWRLISGGARGVDQKAHSLALRLDQETLIVLPTHLKNIYPKSLRSLSCHPKAVLISEYDESQKFHSAHFHRRNAWIVALSQAVLVVQASEKSGTMITAKIALEAGVPVATLPASPMNSQFNGNNQLLYDGASMIRNAVDLEQFLKQEVSFNQALIPT